MELAVLQLLEPWDNAWGLIDDARDWGVGTIMFTTYIDKLPVKVLVDGGSSDNFL